MLLKLSLSLILLSSSVKRSEDPSGTAILKKMYDRYHSKWYRSYTFNQATEVYRNDSLQRTETWHEAILYPDKFRIDFGPSDSGNAVIYKGDSVFLFRNGKLLRSDKDENDLTFLLGGMYFYTFPEVTQKTKKFGYDLSKLHEDKWKGKLVYVIGANKGEDNINQLWIDQKNLVIVRMLNFNHDRREEAIFENHIQLAQGWTETKTIFYINNKLVQVETYYNCRTDLKLDPRIFEPAHYGESYWFNQL